MVNQPDLDVRAGDGVLADGSLRRFEMNDPVVVWLRAALPSAQAKDPLHGVLRRLDQVVDVPPVIRSGRRRSPEIDPN